MFNLNFGGLFFHMKFLKRFSNDVIVSSLGVVRDNRMCVNLEINKLFIIAIFPIGGIFLLHLYSLYYSQKSFPYFLCHSSCLRM